MIWNEQVKDWLIKNMNEYRNTNGRLSINKMQESIESEFSQPMDEGEFIKWTEVNKVKQCDGIKRLKHRLTKHKSKLHKKNTEAVTTGNDVKIETSAGQTVNWRFDYPTKSNLETLEWNGKTYILLNDCLKLLNIHSF